MSDQRADGGVFRLGFHSYARRIAADADTGVVQPVLDQSSGLRDEQQCGLALDVLLEDSGERTRSGQSVPGLRHNRVALGKRDDRLRYPAQRGADVDGMNGTRIDPGAFSSVCQFISYHWNKQSDLGAAVCCQRYRYFPGHAQRFHPVAVVVDALIYQLPQPAAMIEVYVLG